MRTASKKNISPWIALGGALALEAGAITAAQADSYEVTFGRLRSDDDGGYRRADVVATLTPRNGEIGLIRAGPDTGLYHQWATFLLNIDAVDAAGKQLEAIYEPAGVWRLKGWRRGPVTVRYSMALQHDRFPNEPGDNELADSTPDGVMWTGRALLMEGAPSDDISVKFITPEGWRVTTPWNVSDSTGLSFKPLDTDDLLDSAFFAGTHNEMVLDVDGIEARVATAPDMVAERALYRHGLETYLAAYKRLFDAPTVGAPLIIGVHGSFWGGGVMGRTISMTHAGELRPELAAMPTLIVAHETFHLWNAQWRYDQKLRPPVEWVWEGTAVYYTYLTGFRSNDIGLETFLAQIANEAATYETALADGKSIADAGYTKHKDQHSYDLVYSGGMAMSLALDLFIRRESNGEKTFDDVIRFIHERFAGPSGAKLTEAALIAAIKKATDVNAAGFYKKHVGQPNQLPIAELLQSVVGVCLSEAFSDDGERSMEAARCANRTPEQDRAFASWTGGVSR